MAEESARIGHRPERALRLAVAATAFSVLAYEITLTRVFSVLFRSLYVFLILSIAVCGLGLGSALAGLGRRSEVDQGLLVRPLLAFAALLPLPLVLLLTVGRGLVAEANGPVVALLTAVPYVAAGVFLARAFRRHAADAGRLYFFDLGGAGVAALASTFLVSQLGGLAVPLALGVVVSAAALVLARREPAWPAAVIVLGATAGFFASQLMTPWLDLPALTSRDQTKVKQLFRELSDPSLGAKILYTQWSPIARTDVESNNRTSSLFVWTDGDVPTLMEPFKGDLGQAQEYKRLIGFVPYALRPNPARVLAIGPGGGLDVLLALLGGARKIEPVEINPAIREVARRYGNFFGALYSRPEMDPGLIIDEGRSYLSRSSRTYDVIYLALAMSATTQQAGVALVENYLYTTQAFRAYWDHLSPDGLVALVIQHWALSDRTVVTAATALLEAGLTGPEIADRLVYLSIPEGIVGTPYRHLVLISRRPFSTEETDRLLVIVRDRGVQVRYLPRVHEPRPLDALRRAGMTGQQFGEAMAGQAQYLARAYPGGPLVRLSLSPVTDDKPFYVDLSPGLHPSLESLLRGTVAAGLLTIVAVLLWLAGKAGDGHNWPIRVRTGLRESLWPVLYFSGLGLGFLLGEVALIQRLALILGYPTLSLTVILLTLLLGGALGGWVANRGEPDMALARAVRVMVLVGLVQVLVTWVLTPVGQAVLAYPLPIRVAAVALLVAPMGFLMGQPFPTGLRHLGASHPAWVPAAWAVNGVLSVTGSVLAAALASMFGYRVVLLVGAMIYLLTALVGHVWRKDFPVMVVSGGA